MPVCSKQQEDQGKQPLEEDTAAVPEDVGAVRDDHKMAVLVPFRDRFEELMEFVPYLSQFLRQQGKRYKIFVLNQVDNYRYLNKPLFFFFFF